jgi:hypothetical protein
VDSLHVLAAGRLAMLLRQYASFHVAASATQIENTGLSGQEIQLSNEESASMGRIG